MSEVITDVECEEDNKSDFMKMSGNMFVNINYKLAFFMFIFGMLLFSDLFTDSFLKNINGAVGLQYPTTKGTFIQLFIYVILLIVFDLLIKYEWI